MRSWLIILFLALSPVGYAQDRISVVAEQYGPFAIADKAGHVSGIGADILDEISKRSGFQFEIHIYPLARIRTMMERGEVDVAVAESPLWFEADKVTDYTFSKPYLHVFESVYFPANKVFPVQKPLDLKSRRVGIRHGSFNGALDQLFKDGTVIADSSDSADQLLKKLLAGRSDVVLLNDLEFSYAVSTLKLSPNQFVKGTQLTDSPVCMMVRNQGKVILNRINPILEKMMTDGTINNIVNKYVPALK